MKKCLIFLPLLVVVVLSNMFCSCGTKEQYSKEYIERDLKAFLGEYVNTMNDNIEGYLSKDYNDVINKWQANESLGDYNLFGLNSSSTVEKYNILSLSEPKDDRVCAHVKLSVEDEGNYRNEEVNIYMILDNDKWLIDEIGEVKQGMKNTIQEINNSNR